jgi:hypothetical protein
MESHASCKPLLAFDFDGEIDTRINVPANSKQFKIGFEFVTGSQTVTSE